MCLSAQTLLKMFLNYHIKTWLLHTFLLLLVPLAPSFPTGIFLILSLQSFRPALTSNVFSHPIPLPSLPHPSTLPTALCSSSYKHSKLIKQTKDLKLWCTYGKEHAVLGFWPGLPTHCNIASSIYFPISFKNFQLSLVLNKILLCLESPFLPVTQQ